MNSYRTRSGDQTRTFTGPRSTMSSSTASKATPKTSTSRSTTSRNTQRSTTFTNRVNNRTKSSKRVPAPPKFLQLSGGLMGGQTQVKRAEEQPKPKNLSSSLRKPRSSWKQTRKAEEDEDAVTASTTGSEEEPENKKVSEKKEKPKVRRHDPLVYSSKNCTFSQDYLDVLTFDPSKEDWTLSDEEEEKQEAQPVVSPRARTFKPYVKKETSSGFGFWTSGLEDSLLSASGFSYKPAVAKKKPLPKKADLATPKEDEQQHDVAPPTLTSTPPTSYSPMFF